MHDTMTCHLPPAAAFRSPDFMVTPTDLKSMRSLLGLTMEEAGILLGNVGPGVVRDLEKSRIHFVYAGHVALLSGLLTRVNAEIEAALDTRSAPEFLITFPNDGAFRDYEPELASWMPFNSIHRFFTFRLLDAWMIENVKPSIVELVPTQYEEFLASRSGPDTRPNRQDWARAHVQVIRMRSGMPSRGDR